MATERVAVIFGGSGTVGSGVVKALLDKPKAPRIVIVTTSADKLESIKQKFGNLPEDKLLAMVGNLDSEENGAKLRDDILAKTGNITDVLSCIGKIRNQAPVLDFSLSEFKEWSSSLNSHFVVAKTFLPLIGDKDGSSFTFITGGGGVDYLPNFSSIMIYGPSLMQLSNYVRHEWESKSVRINEVCISGCVTVEPSPGTISNTVVGRGIAAVMVNSDVRGKRFMCHTEEDFNKLPESATN